MPHKTIILTVCILILLFSCSAQTKKDKKYSFEQKAKSVDTSFISKATIDGICPCLTTLACDKEMLRNVRPPAKDEERDENWKPLNTNSRT